MFVFEEITRLYGLKCFEEMLESKEYFDLMRSVSVDDDDKFPDRVRFLYQVTTGLGAVFYHKTICCSGDLLFYYFQHYYRKFFGKAYNVILNDRNLMNVLANDKTGLLVNDLNFIFDVFDHQKRSVRRFFGLHYTVFDKYFKEGSDINDLVLDYIMGKIKFGAFREFDPSFEVGYSDIRFLICQQYSKIIEVVKYDCVKQFDDYFCVSSNIVDHYNSCCQQLSCVKMDNAIDKAKVGLHFCCCKIDEENNSSVIYTEEELERYKEKTFSSISETSTVTVNYKSILNIVRDLLGHTCKKKCQLISEFNFKVSCTDYKGHHGGCCHSKGIVTGKCDKFCCRCNKGFLNSHLLAIYNVGNVNNYFKKENIKILYGKVKEQLDLNSNLEGEKKKRRKRKVIVKTGDNDLKEVKGLVKANKSGLVIKPNDLIIPVNVKFKDDYYNKPKSRSNVFNDNRKLYMKPELQYGASVYGTWVFNSDNKELVLLKEKLNNYDIVCLSAVLMAYRNLDLWGLKIQVDIHDSCSTCVTATPNFQDKLKGLWFIYSNDLKGISSEFLIENSEDYLVKEMLEVVGNIDEKNIVTNIGIIEKLYCKYNTQLLENDLLRVYSVDRLYDGINNYSNTIVILRNLNDINEGNVEIQISMLYKAISNGFHSVVIDYNDFSRIDLVGSFKRLRAFNLINDQQSF